ncbi:MAG: hypothetical protein C4K48_05485 [Candidatus Thorarchaeota archaeon]|nr:MAG: hypothetical protein C4K48_05485 [Candidatus Thorarchaeota archaeon]
MDRKRVGIACMIVSGLGVILSTLGVFVASGVDQGGALQYTLSTASVVFLVMLLVTLGLCPELSKAEQNQSQAEPDSSLL